MNFDWVAKLDWSDLCSIQEKVGPFLEELGADKSSLRALVHSARSDANLFSMFERHQLLDYFVLHACPISGARLRLHIHTWEHKQRPHNHRFPFCTRILCGEYQHIWNGCDSDIDERLGFDQLQTAYISTERAGSTYTMSGDVIHTTYTTPDTVSIFLRGPADADRSIIMDRETQAIWWRYPREEETSDRRAKVQMRPDDFELIMSRLQTLGVL